MRLSQQSTAFLELGIFLLLSFIRNTNCSVYGQPFRRELDRRSDYPWEIPLAKLFKQSEKQKKTRKSSYGIFIDHKYSVEEAIAFENALRANLNGGKAGRISFVSDYPFGKKPRPDFVFVSMDTSLVDAIKALRIVDDILSSDTETGWYNRDYTQHALKPANWKPVSQLTQDVRLLNQAPGQEESDAKPDPNASKGKATVSNPYIYIDTLLYSC